MGKAKETREDALTDNPVVAYYRVSTQQQRRSGLGLLAQQEAVRRYVLNTHASVVAEFTEIESGAKCERPQLAEALRLCRVYKAKLVIARLDRLARNVGLIARLIESGADFVAADMPMANPFTIHLLAAVAEYELSLISQRLRGALAAAKRRGVKLGCPKGVIRFGDPNKAHAASVAARRAKAIALARDFAPLLCELRDRGESVQSICRELMKLGYAPPRGGARWHAKTVRSLFRNAGESPPQPNIHPRARERLARIRKRWGARSVAALCLARDCGSLAHAGGGDMLATGDTPNRRR